MPTGPTENCRHCGSPYQAGLRTCPNCGKATVSLGKAYGTFNTKKGGFGLFDVIPGVRDLPAALKVLLIAIFVIVVLAFLHLAGVM
jgi:hypothetical protein